MGADGYALSLVSQCSSVEELVGAFRRYVHRDHVFVPTSGAVAAGRTLRVAITLADGTPVLGGEAEILSSSTIPTGPHQKPGVRLRFTNLDPSASAVMARFDASRAEAVTVEEDPEAATVPSGARADIGIEGEPPAIDATGKAMCTVVEAGSPVAPVAPKAGNVERIDLTPPPKRTPQPTPVAGVVPGKSFKIPSIPAPPKKPETPPTGTVTPAKAAAPSGPSAVPLASDRSGPVSGDLTVPMDPLFKEPSAPVVAPPVVAAAPIAPASTPASGPIGKAANRAVSRTRPPPGLGQPEPKETQRMPADLIAPAPVAPAPPAPPPTPPPTPAGRHYAKTLLGMPAIAAPTTAPTPPPAPPAPPPAAGVDGWSAPEDGSVGEATARSEPPIYEEAHDTTRMPELEIPRGYPEATPPIAYAPATLPAMPPGATVAANTAPAYAAPVSAFATPTPGMTPLPPPVVATPVAAPSGRDADMTDIVVDRGNGQRFGEDTDQFALRRRKRRPYLIGALAGLVVSVGIVLGLAIGGGGDDKKPAAKAPEVAPDAAAKVEPAATIDAGAAVEPTAAIDAGAAVEPAAAIDAAVAAPPDDDPADDDPPDEPDPVDTTPVAPPSGACKVAFTSSPSGVTISIAGKKVGTTPATLDLPCEKATASFTRARYEKETKSFAPSKKKTTKVKVELQRPMFTVKITSVPSGASITVNGKSAGKTPGSAKVRGYEAATIKLTKPGFAPATKRITAKKNNTAVKLTMQGIR